MKILTIEPNIHEQVLKAWDDNQSVSVINQNHEAAQSMYNDAMDYSGPPALITWTGGTTGRSKGVIIPWDAVEARCNALSTWWEPEDLKLVSSFLPAYHSGGMITSRLSVIRAGGKFIEPSEAKDISCIIGTPKHLTEMFTLSNHDLYSKSIDSLRTIIVNGANTTKKQFDVLANSNCYLHNLYGSSENGGISFNGVPLPGYEIRSIRDRLEVKSACNAIGYIGTNKEFPLTEDNYFRTPDSVSLNDKGRIMSVERRDW